MTEVEGNNVLDWYARNKFLVGMTIEFPVLILGGLAGMAFSLLKLHLFPWVNAIGLVFLAAGYVIHLGYAHGEFKKLGVAPHGKSGIPEVLVTSGIYSRIRHPGYLGLILIYFGLAVIFGTVWMLIPAALFATLTGMTALKEERLLKQHFGEKYEEYAAKVPWRFIPGVF